MSMPLGKFAELINVREAAAKLDAEINTFTGNELGIWKDEANGSAQLWAVNEASSGYSEYWGRAGTSAFWHNAYGEEHADNPDFIQFGAYAGGVDFAVSVYGAASTEDGKDPETVEIKVEAATFNIRGETTDGIYIIDQADNIGINLQSQLVNINAADNANDVSVSIYTAGEGTMSTLGVIADQGGGGKGVYINTFTDDYTGQESKSTINCDSDNGLHFTAANGIHYPIATAPSSATDTGTAGEVRWTATHVYLCTATDTWVRAALATW